MARELPDFQDPESRPADRRGGSTFAGRGRMKSTLVDSMLVRDEADEVFGTSESAFRILIVDDEEPTARTLERVLVRYGFQEVRSTTDPRQVLAMFREFQPDLVMLDLHMPGLDGYSVIRQLTVRVPDGQFLPILVLSGDLSAEAKQKALALGAADFLEKPFDIPEVYLRVKNLLRTRELTMKLEERVRDRTRQLRTSEIELANRLALAAELRDYRDAAHVQRVGRTSALLAERLGLSPRDVELIRHAAPLHDIGKLSIPDAILLKPDALSLDEWDILKSHTAIGAQILTGSRSPILQMAEEIALYHHENWDGTGYTPGLAGEDIPIVGRIVAVADVFDALTQERPYKKAWPVADTLSWMQTMRGAKFDPAVFDVLIDVLDSEDLTVLHVHDRTTPETLMGVVLP